MKPFFIKNPSYVNRHISSGVQKYIKISTLDELLEKLDNQLRNKTATENHDEDNWGGRSSGLYIRQDTINNLTVAGDYATPTNAQPHESLQGLLPATHVFQTANEILSLLNTFFTAFNFFESPLKSNVINNSGYRLAEYAASISANSLLKPENQELRKALTWAKEIIEPHPILAYAASGDTVTNHAFTKHLIVACKHYKNSENSAAMLILKKPINKLSLVATSRFSLWAGNLAQCAGIINYNNIHYGPNSSTQNNFLQWKLQQNPASSSGIPTATAIQTDTATAIEPGQSTEHLPEASAHYYTR